MLSRLLGIVNIKIVVVKQPSANRILKPGYSNRRSSKRYCSPDLYFSRVASTCVLQPLGYYQPLEWTFFLASILATATVSIAKVTSIMIL